MQITRAKMVSCIGYLMNPKDSYNIKIGFFFKIHAKFDVKVTKLKCLCDCPESFLSNLRHRKNISGNHGNFDHVLRITHL